ncbi:MAG: ATP-grasp domain-containing protein [Patescibacteria group bacterium]|nr:ATP-grasp domain-containing protein [Patescibacteria group bacterium]
MQKRIMFLGASKPQVAPIVYAKEKGHYIITCDYLPENPGHKYADEYHNVSIINKEAVLALAKKLKIDAIISYATDAGVPTQAYVANKLSLPSSPYKSMSLLVRKDKLRKLLKENNFFTPKSGSFTNYENAYEFILSLKLPAIVKPVDGSGSNGITKIDALGNFKKAFDNAMQFSRNKQIIIEEFFVHDGKIQDGDGFLYNGKIIFSCWGDSHRLKKDNLLIPIAQSFPSTLSKERNIKANHELEKLFNLLNVKEGPFNIEFGFDKNDNFFIFDLNPRSGGNLIPELIHRTTGINLTKYVVDSAVGLDCSNLKTEEPKGYYSSYKIFAEKDGIFKGIWISDILKEKIFYQSLDVDLGEKVKIMERSAERVGVMALKFDSSEEMHYILNNMNKYLKVLVD